MGIFTNFSTCSKGQALRGFHRLWVVLLNKQLIGVSNFMQVDIDKRAWCLCLYILAQWCLNMQINLCLHLLKQFHWSWLAFKSQKNHIINYFTWNCIRSIEKNKTTKRQKQVARVEDELSPNHQYLLPF